MIVHDLKTVAPFYQDILSGTKPFEIRRNDRNFHAGDRLILREWQEDEIPTSAAPAGVSWDRAMRMGYTGRRLWVDVIYVFPGGKYGLDPDYAVLGLSKVKIYFDGREWKADCFCGASMDQVEDDDWMPEAELEADLIARFGEDWLSGISMEELRAHMLADPLAWRWSCDQCGVDHSHVDFPIPPWNENGALVGIVDGAAARMIEDGQESMPL
jgi:hypothetical protein